MIPVTRLRPGAGTGIDRPPGAQYSTGSIIRWQRPMTKPDDLLNNLEYKLDQLLERCETLQRENTELRARESDWQRERVRLVEKNELARGRVEAMIARLKALETD